VTTHALVVGAGPAGTAAAVRLASWCDSVTLVEARPRDGQGRAGEHLPPAAVTAFARLGFGDLLGEGGHEPSPGVRSAWGGGGAVDKEYCMTLPASGLNLRRDRFDETLVRKAELAGVDVQFGTRVRHLRREREEYVATLGGRDGEQTLRADLVVDASGRRAAAARHLGATRRRCDQLVAIVGRIEETMPDAETGRVHVESVQDGWWYGVRFTNGTLLASFMTDASSVPRHPGRAPGLWSEQLRASRLLSPLAAMGHWSGRVEVFDAAAQVLEHDAPPGFLAVGDAAAAYAPLSSWGITKGFSDGIAGADALALAHAGESRALAEHRKTQRRDFEMHRVRQSDFYRAETRWPASPFWRSRHGGSQHGRS
jgi:2-polyprenyl-6-methoxyphenol hydroxylase-like FAD-dependent oxidoreductase